MAVCFCRLFLLSHLLSQPGTASLAQRGAGRHEATSRGAGMLAASKEGVHHCSQWCTIWQLSGLWHMCTAVWQPMLMSEVV